MTHYPVAKPLRSFAGNAHLCLSHYPTHRSKERNQSSELISLRRRFALLLEMLISMRLQNCHREHRADDPHSPC
ncbi:hypothetical protein DKP76_05705 [Falsochrobactrum shanghaiense]|uniref:Uncharacterized protein n=1 Tax=Falsochrobactrum shanghaiense TaxID=2201899 RepID=A0A316JH75_9HYPH|nr:hypothetical protein DKP76_05705 [Falsochrobactrum shanghaiense]